MAAVILCLFLMYVEQFITDENKINLDNYFMITKCLNILIAANQSALDEKKIQ